MRKRIFLIILVTNYVFCFTQNKKLDSLWTVYNNKSEADTNRLKAIDAIAWSLRINNSDTAIILAEQELSLANVIPAGKGDKWVASALKTQGLAYKNKGNFPKALECQLNCLRVNEKLGNKKGIGNCYNSIGVIFKDEFNYVKALDYYLKALPIFESIKDKKGTRNCYGNIGVAYD